MGGGADRLRHRHNLGRPAAAVRRRNQLKLAILIAVLLAAAAGAQAEEPYRPGPDDILMILDQIAPMKAGYRHAEGNSAAHVKAALVGQSVMFAIEDGKPVLGTWQTVFFCEFDGPRVRRVNINYLSCSK